MQQSWVLRGIIRVCSLFGYFGAAPGIVNGPQEFLRMVAKRGRTSKVEEEVEKGCMSVYDLLSAMHEESNLFQNFFV